MGDHAHRRKSVVAPPVAAHRCPRRAGECVASLGLRAADPYHRSPRPGRRVYSDGDAHNLPVHPELNQLSQVMQIDFDELLAGYMDPSGGSLLRQWLS